MRSMLTPMLAALLVLALMLPVCAQQMADISLGGGLVARLRDHGSFATVQERAANVDQKIVEIVSSKDTQHPQVTVKQKASLWTVYAWDVPVMSVYPSEAKVNGITEKGLAQMWAKNLQTQLPKATPCSKLPPEQLGYGKKPGGSVTTTTKPAGTVAAKPTNAAPPAGAVKPLIASHPVKVATKPLATKKPTTTAVKTVTTAQKPLALVGSEAGASLLIVDAMRAARGLNDDEWAGRKEAMSKELYSNLLYYLTGQGTPPKVASTTVVVKPATNVKHVTTTVKAATVKPAGITKPSTITKPLTATKPVTSTTTATTTPAASDASMAKVPQKNRIRAKFAAAKPAYDKLAAADENAAKPIADMIGASRQAFARGDFDEAEKQIDAALSALGVTFTQ